MPYHANQTSFKADPTTHIELVCGNCGVNFQRYRCEIIKAERLGKKSRFCSAKCSGEFSSHNHRGSNHHLYRRIQKSCKRCGKIFSGIIPAVMNRSNRLFCSYNCALLSRPAESVAQTAAKIRESNIRNGVYEKVRQRMKNGGALVACSKMRRISKFQRSVYDAIKIGYPDALLEENIITSDGVKAVDILIPSQMLVIECDGEYWHRNTLERDLQKQGLIEELGYKVYRIKEKEWWKNKKICQM